MSKKHLDPRWVKVRREARPVLLASLPAPCERCGGVMMKGMKLDVGHRSRAPHLTYVVANLRLEHRRCNRGDGARVTHAIRAGKKKGRMPGW